MTRLSPDQESAPESLATILLDWRRREPVRPLLLKRRDLELPARCEDALGALLEDLQSQSDGPLVLSVLSNAEADLNPFAGLAASGVETPFGPTLANLVALLGPGEVHEWNAWPRHLTLLSPAAVEALAQPDTTAANALARLREAGGRLLLADSIFLPDSRADLFTAVDLQPHEQRRPPAWGALTERLDTWLRSGVDLEDPQLQQDLDRFATASAPITVHVTHSWGGGVERWVESFIEADTEDLDFQLRAEGPETGKGCGQRLALYLGNRLEAPVASWWLQPPIRSTAAHDAGYREILRNALERIGAGRVIVSSLVGHSLDALATGLPTLQVLHDYFPRWPLLGVHPGPYLADGKPVELRRALGDHRLLPEFRDRDAAGWEALGRRWREAVVRNGVRVAAPSGSVVELLGRLDPAWPTAQIEIIPHGLQPLPGPRAIMSKERADGRLRLVIPGRIQEGKGRQLLLEALPELTRHARVCLLGSGKDGELFFGRPEVDVIVQYRREDLAETLEGLGPHVAALLSVVPETFSYTLSEMQYLGIPVIGTRVGSLVERIGDGETGWLIEPTAEALVACVRRLAGEVRLIDGARERLSDATRRCAGPARRPAWWVGKRASRQCRQPRSRSRTTNWPKRTACCTTARPIFRRRSKNAVSGPRSASVPVRRRWSDASAGSETWRRASRNGSWNFRRPAMPWTGSRPCSTACRPGTTGCWPAAPGAGRVHSAWAGAWPPTCARPGRPTLSAGPRSSPNRCAQSAPTACEAHCFAPSSSSSPGRRNRLTRRIRKRTAARTHRRDCPIRSSRPCRS
jgi:glycosyltransferase involved in cell wall biosynthesis